MKNSDEIIIKMNRTKLILIVISAAAAVAAGVWLIQSTSSQGTGGHTRIVYTFIFLSALFGIYGIFSAKRLLSRKPGLILSSAGIIDNSSGLASAGFIPWSDIEGFAAYKTQKQIFLIIKLFNPDKHVNSGSLMKRLFFRMNLRACGSPIVIPSNSLLIDFNELASLCAQYLQKYGKPDK
jgi:hypothetical protein